MKNYKLHKSSKWTLPPTAKQCSALAKLGVKDEEMPDTRWQARDIIYRLRKQKEGGEQQ